MSQVTVTFEGDDVVLSSSDGTVRWKAGEGCWELAWQCKDGEEPSASIGSARRIFSVSPDSARRPFPGRSREVD